MGASRPRGSPRPVTCTEKALNIAAVGIISTYSGTTQASLYHMHIDVIPVCESRKSTETHLSHRVSDCSSLCTTLLALPLLREASHDRGCLVHQSCFVVLLIDTSMPVLARATANNKQQCHSHQHCFVLFVEQVLWAFDSSITKAPHQVASRPYNLATRAQMQLAMIWHKHFNYFYSKSHSSKSLIKMQCRHVFSHIGIGGSGAGFGGGTATARKAAFMGQARGALLHVPNCSCHLMMSVQ